MQIDDLQLFCLWISFCQDQRYHLLVIFIASLASWCIIDLSMNGHTMQQCYRYEKLWLGQQQLPSQFDY